ADDQATSASLLHSRAPRGHRGVALVRGDEGCAGAQVQIGGAPPHLRAGRARVHSSPAQSRACAGGDPHARTGRQGRGRSKCQPGANFEASARACRRQRYHRAPAARPHRCGPSDRGDRGAVEPVRSGCFAGSGRALCAGGRGGLDGRGRHSRRRLCAGPQDEHGARRRDRGCAYRRERGDAEDVPPRRADDPARPRQPQLRAAAVQPGAGAHSRTAFGAAAAVL
ncbi:MAG: SOS-response repressor and protease LexA, partial [uncultured Sphingomonadaceae bacterium]